MDFDEWYDARVGGLLKFSYLLCSDHAAAQDMVHDVMVRVLPRWRELSARVDMDAYVRRALINERNSRWRRRRLSQRELQFHSTEMPDLADEVSTRTSLWRECQTLPANQRAAIVLRFYEDRSFSEIAEILQCSEATARSHVHRGLARLRQFVGSSTQPGEAHNG